MQIKIELIDDNNEVIAKRTCEDNFEVAEMCLESLRQWYSAKTAIEEELVRGKLA